MEREQKRGRDMVLATERRVRHLRSDAPDIAAEHAARLSLSDLEEPLSTFLGSAVSVAGLDGFALVAFPDEVGSATLSIYAIGDFRGVFEADSLAQRTRNEIRTTYDVLDEQIRSKGLPVATALWLTNTCGSGFAETIDRIEPDLLPLPIGDPRSQCCLYTLMTCTE